MKCFLMIFTLLSLHNIYSQNDVLDSLTETDNRIVFDSDFRNYGVGLLFKKGKKLEKNTRPYLDTIANNLKKYKDCICEIKIDEFNRVSDELNQKRINVILKELRNRLDTSKVNKKIYWQNDKKPGFQAIFGLNEKGIEYAQRTVDVSVNCSETFYIINESIPFTGYHVWTDEGEIKSITRFVNGKRHGFSYTWGFENNLFIVEYFKGNIVH